MPLYTINLCNALLVINDSMLINPRAKVMKLTIGEISFKEWL